MKIYTHDLPDCMAVWYNRYLIDRDDIVVYGDEICEQGWADLKLDGVNHAMAKKARRARQ